MKGGRRDRGRMDMERESREVGEKGGNRHRWTDGGREIRRDGAVSERWIKKRDESE